jgi:hypothetical protein
MIEYMRAEHKMHCITGVVISVRISKLVIETDDSEHIPIEYNKIIGYRIMQLKDVHMRDRIRKLDGYTVKIEYSTDDFIILTYGKICKCYLHNFIFQSHYDENEIDLIHYDSVIQIKRAIGLIQDKPKIIKS